ncbi:MAG TPA: ATP-dependent DNA helicase [Terriglobales bacterium]|nr:ATP-dependent DNA helicase [Terriglobales bacterium]
MPASRKPAVSSSQLGLFSAASAPALAPALELNPRQSEAVEHVAGPMLVVAGAGTGKTTVLTQRLARLIREGHARADEILAVTYTDNAAEELKQRVRRELGPGAASGLQATTFHAFCYRILQDCGQAFRVLEPQDLWIYLRRRLPELQLKYYTRAVHPAQFLEALIDFFDNCHDELKSAAEYENYVQELDAGRHPLPRVTRSKEADKLTRDDVLARCREIARVFRKVEDMLAADNLGTFSHMILRAMQVLNSDPDLLRREQKRARFLLIDEFQDSNIAQIELAQLLAGKERNIFAVGDPDQAIYRFRGASSAAFEEFVARFPETKAVVLDCNQRSTSAILNCAGALIAQNSSVGCRIGQNENFQRQPLSSERERQAKAQGIPISPEPVSLVMVGGNGDEAGDIAEQASTILRTPANPAGKPRPRCAVLYRSHQHREEVVRELALHGIPFRVEGLDALETCEVRDLLACMRVLPAPVDNAALFRVAALPVFGLDGEAVREALRAAGKQPELAKVLAGVPGGKMVLKTVENARAELAAADWKADRALAIAVKRFGIDPSAPPVAAFREFVEKWSAKPITATGELQEFLEYMEYFPQAGGVVVFQQPPPPDPVNTVQLMTVHGAKGLEFDHVFVVRANNNSFPTNYREKLFAMPAAMRDPRCLAKSDTSDLHREEERRLFYVAMTRARDSLTIYARLGKGKNPRPTAFVRGLMEAHVQSPGWRQREPRLRIAAQAAVVGVTGLGGWMLLPPSLRALAGPLSASSIEMYEACPLKFKIYKDWNIPGDISASLQFGSAMHSALADYFEALRVGRPRTSEQLLQIFERALAELPFDDQHQRELYLKQGREQLATFYESCSAVPVPQVLSTEKTFQFSVQGMLVKGRIDRVDRIDGQRVAIVDYKTGTPKTEVDARRSLQLSIYALAARELWGYVPERLLFYNLETADEVSTTRDEKELRAAQERIAEVARKMAAGEFEPTPGFHCRSCQFRALCPATEEQLYTVELAAASPG